jgi:hypothetical protein
MDLGAYSKLIKSDSIVNPNAISIRGDAMEKRLIPALLMARISLWEANFPSVNNVPVRMPKGKA